MVAICDLASASSEESDTKNQIVKQDRYIGLHFGLSVYTGILGFEFQQHNFAFSAGLPGNVGIKYYFRPDGHSLFVGGYFLKYSSRTEGGIGPGFRWRWGTGWDFSLGFGIGYGEKKETIGLSEITTRYVGIRPVLTFGYSF